MTVPDSPLTANLQDPGTCLHFLETIKHTRLEGLIVEIEFDQVFLPGMLAAGWRRIDALVLRRVLVSGGEEYLVLPRSEEGIEALVKMLRKTGKPVRRLSIESGVLVYCHDREGKPCAAVPVSASTTSREIAQTRTALSAIDRQRVLAMYWGFGYHLRYWFAQFVKETIIKDYFISAEAKYLWDLDRFIVDPDGHLYFVETKHKFPTPKKTFGMNRGEVAQAKALQKLGFRIWHAILVKPVWETDYSSMYLFFDRRAREHAVWIAGDMGAPGFFAGGTPSQANAATSLYGQQPVKYINLPLSGFRIIGRNAEPAGMLAEKLAGCLRGEKTLPVLDADYLERCRIGGVARGTRGVS